MTDMLEYTLKILPGCILFTVIFLMLPKNKTVAFKIFLLIMGFILIRDAMTPIGFWQLGLTEQAMWVRFVDDHFILIGLGVVSILLTIGVVYANPRMKSLLIWSHDSKIRSTLVGIAGACVVCLPFLLIYSFVDLPERGGEVAKSLLLPLLFMALAGNFMEEVLFRGYLQGYLDKITGKYRAALLSGLFFAAGHTFLTTTVTDLGWPILAFTLYEGLICAFVRIKYGILASTLTHGLTIFFLSSGLF